VLNLTQSIEAPAQKKKEKEQAYNVLGQNSTSTKEY
jgi:hypothetical protein